MRTLARFEFALGRRVPWGFDGHQIHVAPHAFADAERILFAATIARIFFGYFNGAGGKPVFTCLSHDVVAHETTHAILDGLRGRYLEPSSPGPGGVPRGLRRRRRAALGVLAARRRRRAARPQGAGGKLIDAKHARRARR